MTLTPEEWRRVQALSETLGVSPFVDDHGILRRSVIPLIEHLVARILKIESDTPGIMNPTHDMFSDG